MEDFELKAVAGSGNERVVIK